MKRIILVIGLLSFLSSSLRAASAEEFVARGRAHLCLKDIAGAKAKFEAALVLSPKNQDANVLAAATRVLSILNTPEGNSLLDRLGFDSLGRNLISWRSRLPMDTNNLPLAPANFLASELSGFIRTNFLSAIRASELNLSRITQTNYTLILNSAETQFSSVTIDYGDIQMLRALLRISEYLACTIYSWNLEEQLSDLRAYATDEDATVEEFLRSHPNLLTFTTTNDLAAAKAAFLAAADHYQEASAWIRARPQSVIRLFNYDLDMADAETRFRQTLADLTSSLVSPIVLSIQTNLTINLANHFSGQHSWRSFLPSFYDNQYLLGSLPDKTFGGVMDGLTDQDLDHFFAQRLEVASRLTSSIQRPMEQVQIQLPTLPGRVYGLEYSTNLTTWSKVSEFLSTNSAHLYTLDRVSHEAASMRFYRLSDLSEFTRVSGRVLDRNTGNPVVGAVISSSVDEKTATADQNGHFMLQTHSLPPSFVPCLVMVQAPGFESANSTYYGETHIENVTLWLTPENLPAPSNDRFANRIALTGLPVTASGSTCQSSREPGESGYNEGSVWWSWTSPYTGKIRGTIQSLAGWSQLGIYTGNDLKTLSQIASGWGNQVTFDAVKGQTYQVSVSASSSAFSFLTFSLAAEPILVITSPLDGSQHSGPLDINIEGLCTTPDSTLKEIKILVDGDLIGSVTNNPFSFAWKQAPPGFHTLTVTATDALAQEVAVNRFITIRSLNDNFSERTTLTGASTIVQGYSTSATRETGEPSHATISLNKTTWWSWISPLNGPIIVTAISDDKSARSAAAVAVYTGTSLANLSCVTSNEMGHPAGSQTSFNAQAGTVYQIAVAGLDGGSYELQLGPGTLPFLSISNPTNNQTFKDGEFITFAMTANNPAGEISSAHFLLNEETMANFTAPPYMFSTNLAPGIYNLQGAAINTQNHYGFSKPISIRVSPLNDDFSNRTLLTGSNLSVRGSNLGAGVESGEPRHAGKTGGTSVWWTWTAPANGTVTVSTQGTEFQPLLAIYTGASLSSLTSIASSSYFWMFGSKPIECTFSVTAGTVYHIAVDGDPMGYGAAPTGRISLSLNLVAK